MAARRYYFLLPIEISQIRAALIPAGLKEEGLWELVPKKLQKKFLSSKWEGLTITKEDLNLIDAEGWLKSKKFFAKL